MVTTPSRSAARMALSVPSAPPTARQGAESVPIIRVSAVLAASSSLEMVSLCSVVFDVFVGEHVAGEMVGIS